MKKRARIFLAVAIAIIVGAAYVFWPRGVLITVTNGDKVALRAVTIHVTGNEIILGDLQPSAQASVRVKPLFSARLMISYHDANGKEVREKANFEFFRGDSGSIEVTLTSHGITNIKHRIQHHHMEGRLFQQSQRSLVAVKP